MRKIATIIVLLSTLIASYFLRKEKFINEIPKASVSHVFLLTTLEIWDEYGAESFKYAPIQTYQHPGDKFISYYKRLEDRQGNNYYVSFPPLTFLFPYLIMKIGNLPPQQPVIQLINLFLHFFSALFIFGICNLLTHKKWFELYFPSLLSFVAYLFIPHILQMHTWNYFAEMHGQVALVIASFFAVKFLTNNSLTQKPVFIFLLLFSFALLLYSEWIGLFFVFTFLLILFLNHKKIVQYKILIVLISLVSLLILGLTVFQFASINGFQEMLHAWKIRMIERSGFFGENYSLDKASYSYTNSYLLLFRQLQGLFSSFGYLLVFLILLIFTIKKGKLLLRKLKKNTWVLILLTLPSLIHFFIFFNANILHYTYIAKFGILICIGLAVVIHLLFTFLKKSKIILLKFFLFFSFSLLIIYSIHEFRKINSDFTDFSSEIKSISNNILLHASDNQCVFIEKGLIEESQIIHLTYLCKRNMMFVKDLSEAKRTMQKFDLKHGLYFFDLKTFKKFKSIKLP